MGIWAKPCNFLCVGSGNSYRSLVRLNWVVFAKVTERERNGLWHLPSKDCACKSLCKTSDAGGLLVVNSAISGGYFELNLTIFDVVPFLLYLFTLTLP